MQRFHKSNMSVMTEMCRRIVLPLCLAQILMVVLGGCEKIEPSPVPEIPYDLCDKYEEVSGSSGEITICPFRYGEDMDYVPFVFIKELYPLSLESLSLFANSQEDMSLRLNGLDVRYYGEEKWDDILASQSQEYPVSYKWVEVTSCKREGENQELVVKFEENPMPVSREIYIHLYDGSQWGVVCIHQKKQ